MMRFSCSCGCSARRPRAISTASRTISRHLSRSRSRVAAAAETARTSSRWRQELSRTEGQIRKGDMTGHAERRSRSRLRRRSTRAGMFKLNELKHRIERPSSATRAAAVSEPAPPRHHERRVGGADRGREERPMFAVGRAELEPHARDILLEIGRTLNGAENKISISGHTDATPYASGEKGYSNWELSSDRANASRRVLLAAGSKTRHRTGARHGLGRVAAQDRHIDAMNRRISRSCHQPRIGAGAGKTSGPWTWLHRGRAGRAARESAGRGEPACCGQSPAAVNPR